MLKNVLKCRFSQLWHMGKAHMFKIPGGPITTNDACPLCGQPDSGSHMLGGCSHPEIKKMTIFRHNEAHRLMLKGIIKGRIGSFLIIADVGKTEELRSIGVHHKRIPKYVLPDSTIARLSAYEDVHLGVITERFASPLNFNICFDSYCSMHSEDSLFGATHDAYSHKWQGSSQANPEYEAKDMEKALR